MKRSIILTLIALLIASCATHQQFYKADIIGFGEDARTSYAYHKGSFKNLRDQSQPIDLLYDTPSMQQALDVVIPRGNNTTLYYATDLATDRIKWVRRKVANYDKETQYYLFILTDGLDNASVQVAKNNKQVRVSSPERYRERIERKLKSATGLLRNGSDLTTYVLLCKGKDLLQMAKDNELTDEQFENYLDKQFECFRYATRGEVPELIQEKDFPTIEKVLEDRLVNNSLDFRVAKDYRNKRIRILMTDPNGHKATLEGTLKRNIVGRYKLVNVSEEGIIKDSLRTDRTRQKGRTLMAHKGSSKDENIFFTISGLKYSDGSKMFKPSTVKQSFYDGQLWQANTEYEQKPYIRPNAYCIFVVDGSMSLTDKDIEAEKTCIKKILSLINPGTKVK